VARRQQGRRGAPGGVSNRKHFGDSDLCQFHRIDFHRSALGVAAKGLVARMLPVDITFFLPTLPNPDLKVPVA
jgi:hypothetical protein